jgi:hypothetical protein
MYVFYGAIFGLAFALVVAWLAANGTPLRSLMEWMGHRDFATTLVYADYAPDPAQGAAFVQRAFGSPRNVAPSLEGRTFAG